MATGTGEKCNTCGKKLVLASDLREHNRKLSHKTPYQCRLCGKKYTLLGRLTKHMRLHTGKSPYHCKECGNKFTPAERLHTTETSHECVQCGKKFTQSGHLKNHVRLHTGEKPHQCKQCGKHFAQSSNLRVHMRLHTGEKPYQCKQCGKHFTQSSSLRVHTRLHTGEKVYQCKQCEMHFTQPGKIRIHMRLHRVQKGNQCEQCGKSFSHSSNLKRHMRVHTGEKPYQCKRCRKKFTRATYLRAHMRLHTGEKPYECQECGNNCTSSSHLRKHSQTYRKRNQCSSCLTLSASKFQSNSDARSFTQNIANFIEPSMVSLQTISGSHSSTPFDGYFILRHPNIAVTYGMTVSPCGRMLVMEKVVTCLSDLLAELGNEVTVRERVDICYGIVCAVDYLHHHVGIVHGYINVDNVFITSRFTAKLLDPSVAFLMHDKMCQRAELFAHDLHHLICLLITTLYDMYPAFISARDRLRDMISSEEIKKEREECMSTSVLLHILDELINTEEYRDCSRKHELSSHED